MKNILEELVKSTIIFILTKIIKVCRQEEDIKVVEPVEDEEQHQQR